MDASEQPLQLSSSREEISASCDPAVADSISSLLADDPTHRVGQLKLARKKPVSTKPAASISEAITLMMLHNFSQLPVMRSSRNVVGLFSWKSLAQRLAFGKSPSRVCDAMETPVVIDTNRSLFEAARLVAESDCVLIKDEDGTISGILTSYDLSVTFAERSEPFLLLEQIEKHIRNHLKGRLSLAEMKEVRDSLDGQNKICDVSRLSFGDYVRIFQKPEKWKKFDLPLDQTTFVAQLDDVRDIRNKLMHFDPNGLATEIIDGCLLSLHILLLINSTCRNGGIRLTPLLSIAWRPVVIGIAPNRAEASRTRGLLGPGILDC